MDSRLKTLVEIKAFNKLIPKQHPLKKLHLWHCQSSVHTRKDIFWRRCWAKTQPGFKEQYFQTLRHKYNMFSNSFWNRSSNYAGFCFLHTYHVYIFVEVVFWRFSWLHSYLQSTTLLKNIRSLYMNTVFTKRFRYPKWRVSCTLVGKLPLHKPYT